MKLLIEFGVSLHIGDNNCDTPLHVAASHGNLQAARVLADKKNLNAKNKHGQQPCKIYLDVLTVTVHVAAAKGHQDIIAFLLTMKPEINTKDADGNTAVGFRIYILISEASPGLHEQKE